MGKADFIQEIGVGTNELICALIKVCFDLGQSAQEPGDRFACGEAGEMISRAVYGKPAEEIREFVKTIKRPNWLNPLKTNSANVEGKWAQLGKD